MSSIPLGQNGGDDFPNPRGYLWPIDGRSGSVTSQLLLFLQSKDVFYGAAGMGATNEDQPNPQRGYQQSVANKVGYGSLENLSFLVNKDIFFGLAGAPMFDQPNPRGYTYPSSLRLFSTPVTLSGVTTWAPGISQIWYSGVSAGFSVTWGPMGPLDVATAIQRFGASNRSVEFTGNFGGATVTLQGSNDGVNYFTLHDPLNNSISLTSAGLVEVLEDTQYIQPVVTGGILGTTSVAVTLYLTVRK